MKPLLLPALALAAALLAGCDTFERRAQEKSAAFATLTPAQRAQLKQGSINIGDTTDMVYIALGEPDEKRETATAAGRRTVWIYHSYYRENVGVVTGAYRRDLVYDRATRRYVLVYAPLPPATIDDVVTEEVIRVTFRDGKVAEIEKPKD